MENKTLIGYFPGTLNARTKKLHVFSDAKSLLGRWSLICMARYFTLSALDANNELYTYKLNYINITLGMSISTFTLKQL